MVVVRRPAFPGVRKGSRGSNQRAVKRVDTVGAFIGRVVRLMDFGGKHRLRLGLIPLVVASRLLVPDGFDSLSHSHGLQMFQAA